MFLNLKNLLNGRRDSFGIGNVFLWIIWYIGFWKKSFAKSWKKVYEHIPNSHLFMQLKILRTNMFTVNIRNVFKTELGSRGYKVLKNKSLDHHLFIIFRILTYKTLSTLILWDFCKHVRGKRLQPDTLVFVVLLIIISPPWWFGIYATGSVGYRWGLFLSVGVTWGGAEGP